MARGEAIGDTTSFVLSAMGSGVDFFFRNSQHPSCKSSSICPGSGIFVRPINRVGPLVGCSRLPHGSCRQSLVEVRSGKENKCIEVVLEAEFNAAFVGAGEIAILDPPFFMLRQKGGIRCEEREGVSGIMQFSVHGVAGRRKRPVALGAACFICGECNIEDFFAAQPGEKINAGFEIAIAPPVSR